MPSISLRRLLSRLTVLALSTSAAAPVAATPAEPVTAPSDPVGNDADSDLDAELTIDLGDHGEHMDPADAAITLGRGLALALNKMRPLGATHLATTWALSRDHVRRLALAHALEWLFPLVGDGVVIDHLSRDTHSAIRVAAARAAWARRTSGGDQGVLARLTEDPDPAVRLIASSAR